jgi:hypothetical protein
VEGKLKWPMLRNCFVGAVFLVLSSMFCLFCKQSSARELVLIQPREIILVYSDGSVDNFEELKSFAARVSAPTKLVILDGRDFGEGIPRDWQGKYTLALFARSSRSLNLKAIKFPSPLLQFIQSMPDYEGMQGKRISLGVVAGRIGCYGDNKTTAGESDQLHTKYFDIFGNFDPLNDGQFCRAQAYAAVLGLGWDFCHATSCAKLMEHRR